MTLGSPSTSLLMRLLMVLDQLFLMFSQMGLKILLTSEWAQVFHLAKQQLTSSKVLTRYDHMLPINLTADVSAYGFGPVISHVFPDGSEKPIAYASQTNTSSERTHAQIEKEALSLVFGVKKVHQYLYGRKFNLITDHKPLTANFGPKKGFPSLAAARFQRWAVLLSTYT